MADGESLQSVQYLFFQWSGEFYMRFDLQQLNRQMERPAKYLF